jgi:CDP-glucose 4,6-dehydratase
MPQAPTDFWRDRPVLVTGGTGFVGSHLTAELVSCGAAVTVLRRDRPPLNAISRKWVDAVTFVDGALEDRATVERALGEQGVRTVFHLAAQSQVGVANRNPVSTFEANIAGTWVLLEAVRRSPGVEGVVVASSDKAYGAHATLPYSEELPLRAVHPYDVSKACADMIAACYGTVYDLPVCVTRCGNFFGPGDPNWARLVPGTIRSLMRGERPVIRSDGTMTRDYLYVGDGVKAYMLLGELLSHSESVRGQAYNFSLDNPISVLELVALIQKVAGTDLEPIVLNEASHEIGDQWLSSERARKDLGWSPSWTIEQALAETVEWYRALVLAGG